MTTTSPYSIGDIVHVQPRTGPGENFPGGVARVIAITKQQSFSVRYVLDGRVEQDVQLKFVHPHQFRASRSMRDRSLLLGRCRRCGSLRSDCGSCDQTQLYQEIMDTTTPGISHESSSSDEDRQLTRHLNQSIRKLKKLKASVNRNVILDEGSSSSSDDDEIVQSLQASNTQQKQRKLRQERRVMQVLTQPGDSESDKDDDTAGLAKSPTQQSQAPLDYGDNEHSDDSQTLRFRTYQEPMEEVDESQQKFIQPEGNAADLPRDVRDITRDVPYVELPQLIDRLVQELETERLPTAKRRIVELERRYQSQNGSQKQQECCHQW